MSMFIIGLTGGIASGKSTVARMLEEKGAYLIDADQLAREAVEPQRPAWRKIVDWLGEEILLADGSLDRIKLADIVFNDRRKLEELNRIVHPWVGARFKELSDRIASEDPDAIVVYDIPLLIEAGMQEMVGLVLLVYVPREVQVSRLIERDGIDRAAAETRLKAQMPLEEKKKQADVIIDNSGAIAETARQVEQFWRDLKEIKGGKKCPEEDA